MRLQQSWIALSQTRKTVMYTTVTPSLVLPPAQQTPGGAVRLTLGDQADADGRDLWIVITRDDARSAA